MPIFTGAHLSHITKAQEDTKEHVRGGSRKREMKKKRVLE